MSSLPYFPPVNSIDCPNLNLTGYSVFINALYTENKAGQLVIVEDEAKVVRLIYSLYLSGIGYRQIKGHLEENGIKTVSGKDTWSTSTIDRILSNEKYAGTLITQKTYVADFLDGRQVRNEGILPQQVFEQHHDAIIDKAAFEQVQTMKEKRSRSRQLTSAC